MYVYCLYLHSYIHMLYLCMYVQITAVLMCVLKTSFLVLLLGVNEIATLLVDLLCSEGCKANGKAVMLLLCVCVFILPSLCLTLNLPRSF